MTRTLDSSQTALVASSGLIVARLVKLTTYTDRDAKTGPTSFYFSNYPLVYDYGNTGTDQTFWDILASVSADDHSMVHVPQPRDLAPYDWGMELNFNNQFVLGRRAYTLLSEENLHGADIEYSELAIPSLEGPYPVDLSALTGDEHTVLFRGVVRRPHDVTDATFSLACQTTTPDLSSFWHFATADTVSQTDFGKRLPQVYGQAKKVPCINYLTGAVTVTVDELQPTWFDIDIEVADTSDFPQAGNFNVFLSTGEEITVDVTDATHLNIKTTGRAQNGTTALLHLGGVEVREMTSVIYFIVAGHECSAVDDVYLRNPYSEHFFKVPSGSSVGYTVDTQNSTLVAGETVSTVEFTKAQFLQLRLALQADANRVSQAVFGAAGEETSDPDGQRPPDLLAFATCMPEGLTGDNSWADFTGSGQNHQIKFRSADGGSSTQDVAVSVRQFNPTVSAARIFQFRTIVKYSYNSHDDAVDFYIAAQEHGRTLTWDGGQPFKKISYAALASDDLNVTVTSDWLTLYPNDTVLGTDLGASVVQTAPEQDGYVQYMCDFDGAGDSSIAIEIDGTEGDTGLMTINDDGTTITSEDLSRLINGAWDLQLFADVDGYKSPVTPPPDPGEFTVIDDMETNPSGDWSVIDCTNADESTIVFEGSGSLEITSNASTTWTTYLPITPADWTDQLLQFWCYMEDAMYQALLAAETTAAFNVIVSSVAAVADDFIKLEVLLTDITPDQWVRLSVWLGDDPLSETGTFDPTDVRSVGFTFTQDAATAGRICYFDKFERADWEPDPDYPYSVEEDVLIEHPTDVIAHWVREIGGEVIGTADLATALTNLGSNKIAGDVRAAGIRWEEIAQALAYSARSNLVPDQTTTGREWRILTPNSSYQFPAPTKLLTVSPDSGFSDAGRSLNELFTDSLHRYAFDPSLGSGEEAYASVVTANPTTSDVSVSAADLETARKAIGSRLANPAFLRFINEEATAEDVVGYYVHEAIAFERGVFTIENLAWMDGYDLQVGDIVWVTLPWTKAEESQIASLDQEASDWAGGGGGSPADADLFFREGGGSLRLNADGITRTCTIQNDGNMPVVDIRDRAFSVWVSVDTASRAALESIKLRVSSGGSAGAQYKEWTFPAAGIPANTWTQLRVQPGDVESASSGVFDPTHTRNHQFTYLQDSATGSTKAFFDDYRIENPRVPCRVIRISKNHENFHSDITAVQVETV